MRHAERPIERVGDPGIEIDLNDDRHREQRDDQRLAHDLFALKAEQQHKGCQKSDERDRLQVKDIFLQQAAAATGHDIVAFAQVLASAPGVETIKIVPLSADVVELYARVQITRGASEASAKTAPFFVYEVVLRTPVGWRIASIVPVSAQ